MDRRVRRTTTPCLASCWEGTRGKGQGRPWPQPSRGCPSVAKASQRPSKFGRCVCAPGSIVSEASACDGCCSDDGPGADTTATRAATTTTTSRGRTTGRGRKEGGKGRASEKAIECLLFPFWDAKCESQALPTMPIGPCAAAMPGESLFVLFSIILVDFCSFFPRSFLIANQR